MKARMRAVRVYGSASQYGATPRSSPRESIALDGYPNTGGRAEILLGVAPEADLRANKVTRALGQTFLEFFLGTDPVGRPDEMIERFMDEDIGAPTATDHNWYVTVALEREIDVADSDVGDSRFVWLDLEVARSLEADFLRDAVSHIDLLSTYTSTLIESTFFERVVVDDRVFFLAPDREAFGRPRSSSRANASVARNIQSPRTTELEQLLRTASEAPRQKHEWLQRVKLWYLAAIRESDPWRQFFWCFLAIEALTHELAEPLLKTARLNLQQGLGTDLYLDSE